MRYSTFDYSERIKELREDIKESILTGEIKETKLKEGAAEDGDN